METSAWLRTTRSGVRISPGAPINQALTMIIEHHLDIIFKMDLVNDRIEYANPKRKSGGYRVVEGDKNAKSVISHDQTRKLHKEARIAGRRKQIGKKFQRNN